MAAAAPSTWRATSPSPPSRASSRPRISARKRLLCRARRPRVSAARYSATNSGRPSLSRYTRRSSPGAAASGRTACTSFPTSSSLEPGGTHDRRPSVAGEVRRQPAEPMPGGHRLAAPARPPAAAAGRAACGRGRRSRPAWPRRRRGRRRAGRPPADGPSHAALMTAATPSSTRTWAPGPSSGSGPAAAGPRLGELGQQQRGIRQALGRQDGGPAAGARWLAASRSSSTIGPYGRPASSSWQRAASTTAPLVPRAPRELVVPAASSRCRPRPRSRPGRHPARPRACASTSAASSCARPTSGSSGGGSPKLAGCVPRRVAASASGGGVRVPVAHLLVERRRLLDRRHAELLAQRPNAVAVLLERAPRGRRSRRTGGSARGGRARGAGRARASGGRSGIACA